MTFGKHPQPTHDRATAARKAKSPWRKGNMITGNTVRLRRQWDAEARAERERR